jgi:ribonuclease Z
MTVRDLTILGCSSQQPTRLRNHGAYLLRWNNEGFLIDPGEGTQRQFIFADIAPTCVTRILVTHFHGDHCLGLGSMLMRLNLDKVKHPIHCYYPASGKVYFDRLRYGTMYHDQIEVIEHPIDEEGVVHDDNQFKIEAKFLNHGVENLAYRITEKDTLKFDKELLQSQGIKGLLMKELLEKQVVNFNGHMIKLKDVSHVRKGDAFACVIDTRYCEEAIEIAKGAKLFLCESTYLEEHKDLAYKHFHLTAKEAATIAKKAEVGHLILTHFSARYTELEPFVQEAKSIFDHVDVADDFKRFQFPK